MGISSRIIIIMGVMVRIIIMVRTRLIILEGIATLVQGMVGTTISLIRVGVVILMVGIDSCIQG